MIHRRLLLISILIISCAKVTSSLSSDVTDVDKEEKEAAQFFEETELDPQTDELNYDDETEKGSGLPSLNTTEEPHETFLSQTEESISAKHVVERRAVKQKTSFAIERDKMMAESFAAAVVEQEDRQLKQTAHPAAPQTFHSGKMNPELRSVGARAQLLESVSRRMGFKLGLKTAKQRKTHFHNWKLPAFLCKKPSPLPGCVCDRKTPYRTADGTCNNLQTPLLGGANTPYLRLAKPDYADGVSFPRASKNGDPLPNARRVSFTVFTNNNATAASVSHMSMIWGQFVDHDITLAAPQEDDCRGKCQGLQGECFGIPVPRDDPRFRLINVTCIPLRRYLPSAPDGCKFGPRQQVNSLTAFIDGSQIYGANKAIVDSLRNKSCDLGLLLEMDNPSGASFRRLLPAGEVVEGVCRSPDKEKQPCFRSGDVRVNENQGLMSMHVLWSREHNRIASALKSINPGWNGDKIYNETRKIVGAQLQHITYHEYLPELLGKETRKSFGLILGMKGFYKGYDNKTDPSIVASFAGAAYRFGHSQVQNQMNRFKTGYKSLFDPVPTKEFGNPTFLYDTEKGGVDSIVRGLAVDPAQRVDGNFAKAIQENLIRLPGDISDLAAINIQRGREYGLPGYNVFRKLSGLKEAQTFADFQEIPSQALEKLKSTYVSPDDVDLFVGGLLENPSASDGILGPTFTFLVAQQFQALRNGDRFWYENEAPVTGFTIGQLIELRKVSLARVICENSDNILRVVRRPLSSTNPTRFVLCSNLPQMDLEKWRERPPAQH